MIEFLTLITLMCTQPGVGANGYEQTSRTIRQEAFAAQSQCIKKLHAACIPSSNYWTVPDIRKAMDCFVKQL